MGRDLVKERVIGACEVVLGAGCHIQNNVCTSEQGVGSEQGRWIAGVQV